MIDIESIKKESEPDGKIIDYDANINRRRDEMSESLHRLRLTIVRKLSYVLLIFGVVFLVALFFVIMPFSVIEFDGEGGATWLMSYSYAFVYALGGFGTTVLAVIVSELLKQAYKFLRKAKHDSN